MITLKQKLNQLITQLKATQVLLRLYVRSSRVTGSSSSTFMRLISSDNHVLYNLDSKQVDLPYSIPHSVRTLMTCISLT